MKQIYLLLALALLTISTHAQNWSGNTPGNIYYNSGNVGIGTTNPNSHLEVFDATDPFILLKSNNNRATLHFRKHNTGHDGFIRYHSNARLAFHLDAANAAGVDVNEYLTISNTGNVGIGVPYPEAKLVVDGDVHSNGLLKRDDGTTDLWMYRDGDVGNWSLLRSNKGEGIAIIGQPDVVGLAVSRTNSNVLIGKTSQTNPAYKLDIAGSVRANEMVVNTTGADYVFEKDYDLKSLDEVEAFIEQHGHLPEIPTAVEMQQEGMAVGELNTKLLEKIEELTLYVIQQGKTIKDQNEKIEALQEGIIELENLINTQ